MINNEKNQNDTLINDNIDLFGIKYSFYDKPINRINTKPEVEDKSQMLKKLKNEILNITNCDLKNSSKNLVFSDGDENSSLMVIGEGPGEKEDEIGKPFMGEAGKLLNKMFKAINIDRKNIYITNVVNYRPPNNRKPLPNEIKRYSEYLKRHISIIEPKLLICMGSTAMESLFGSKIKISKERGAWKELIINNRTYDTLITFHPAYLLRQPDQKKYSWNDLKEIRKKIDLSNIKI